MRKLIAFACLFLFASFTSGQVYINGVLQGGSSYSYLWSGGISMLAPTTDVAPDPLLLRGANAFPGATVNTAGANTLLAGGIGKRILTVIAYDHGSMAGSTVTITVNGTATVLTEGAGEEWLAATSNSSTATSLAAAVSTVSGVSAAAGPAAVLITPAPATYSLTIAKSAADAGMTATSGTDGAPYVINKLGFSDVGAAPDVGFARSAAGVMKVTDGSSGLGDLFISSTVYLNSTSNGPQVRCIGTDEIQLYLYTGNGLALYHSPFALEIPGTSVLRWTAGAFLRTGDSDLGLARSAAGVLKVTDGSTGNGNVVASTAITAVGTAAANGYIRTGVYKRAWTNAEVTAFGAVLSGDLKVATLPAKTIVRNAYLVIDSQASGTTTLTVSLGRTSTAYIDYTVASNAMVGANTVYGDATTVERGTNLTGWDLPSYTAAVDVYVQFVATDASKKLADVLGCTGQVYLLTETLP